MRDFVRPVAAALCVAAAFSVVSTGAVFAQARQQQMAPAPKQQAAPPPQADQPQPIKQIALTDKQIEAVLAAQKEDRKSTRLNSSHGSISYAVFCLKKKNKNKKTKKVR